MSGKGMNSLANLVSSMKKSMAPPAGPPKGGSFGPARPPVPSFGPARPPPREAPTADEDEPQEGPSRPPPSVYDDVGAEEGPALPPGGALDDDEEEEQEAAPFFPVSQEIALKHHTRTVTALAVDPPGARLITGGLDNTLKLFDFNGMTKELRSFRTIEPHENHPIRALSWSPTGECFLCVDGSPQPKIYDRDGRELAEFVRGDMYIVDLRNTKGHTAAGSGGQWHPVDRATLMTCGEDGSVRIWDAYEAKQRTVIKPSLVRPGRVHVTACVYNTDGSQIAGALEDGSIQIWDARGARVGAAAAIGAVPAPRNQMIEKQTWNYVSGQGQWCKGAHPASAGATSLAFAMDGVTLASRGGEGTVKLWDMRSFNKPVSVLSDLPNDCEGTQVIFSPDERHLVTGVSGKGKDEAGGGVVFIDRDRGKVVKRIGCPWSVVAVAWHPALNQVVYGGGDRKHGEARVLFDPAVSKKGALLAISRAPRRPDPADWEEPMQIVAPLADRGPRRTKRKMIEEQLEREKKLHIPDVGMASTKPGRGGRIGTSQSSLLTQHIIKNAEGGEIGAVLRLDPREAILKHADAAAKAPMFTGAYAKTQPKPIFAEEEEEEQK